MYTGLVTEVSWERVFITIRGTINPEEPDWDEERPAIAEKLRQIIGEDYDPQRPYFFLRTKKYGQTYLLSPELSEEGNFSIRINVTEFRDRKQIPNGAFRISVFHGGFDSVLRAVPKIAEQALELSRPFIFNKTEECYVVNVLTSSNEADPSFLLRTYLYKRKRVKKITFRRIRDHVIKVCIDFYYSLLYHLVPHNGKRILLATETRGYLQGNLEAIYNRLYERGLDKKFHIYTSFRRASGGNEGALTWLKLMTRVAICDTILIDDYAPFLNWMMLKKKTRLIQVWHAGVGFKAVGFARFGKLGTPVLDAGHRQYDYAIVGSKALKKVYAEVFGIEEDAIIPTGLPRMDVLFDPKRQKKFEKEFFEEYPSLEGKKLILFAPTFRGMGAKTANYPYEKLDFHRIYDFCGEEYLFLFKMHPFIREEPPIPEECSDRLIDFSHYPDVNELLRVTDLLITDYSSIIYDYAVFHKPMLFFAYDKEAYSAIRGFQNDYDEFAPGKVCTDFDQMEAAIRNRDFETEKAERFLKENFDYMDGKSTDRFIDWFLTNPSADVLSLSES